MARICVYPGSFDPITLGHMDVIRRAAALFDQVIVAVLYNPHKKGTFSITARTSLIEKAVASIPNVVVDTWDGLLVDYVSKTGACAAVRGIRGASDLESEMNMANINAMLGDGMETVFLPARPEHVNISSSVVREAALFGVDLTPFVPAEIVEDVMKRFRRTNR